MLGLLTHPMPDTTPATIGCLTDSPPRARIASWASHTSTWPMYVECFYPPDDYPVEPLKTFVAVKVRSPETVLARRGVPLGATAVYSKSDRPYRCVRAPHGSAFLR